MKKKFKKKKNFLHSCRTIYSFFRVNKLTKWVHLLHAR